MKKIRVEVEKIDNSKAQSGAYLLFLKEVGNDRRVAIVIGFPEAQSIELARRNIPRFRPLTHDLFKNFIEITDFKLIEVDIVALKDGVFYSELVFEKNGKIVTIDSRTSDAIALAIRINCPIFIDSSIIEEVGLPGKFFKQHQENKDTKIDKDLKSYSVAELERLMEEAIKKEDYEFASLIRDEIQKRKK